MCRLTQLSARQITTSTASNSAKAEVHEGYKALKEVQKKYQVILGVLMIELCFTYKGPSEKHLRADRKWSAAA